MIAGGVQKIRMQIGSGVFDTEYKKDRMGAAVAAHLMGRKRVRRLPVVEGGKVRGILSLDDLAADEQNAYDAADALGEICAYFQQNKC